MNPFTYPAWDLTSLTALDSLPYGQVSFGEVLNQPGPFQGQIKLSDPKIQAMSWGDASRTGRTLVGVDLAGVLVWGGILWTRKYVEPGYTLAVGAQEFGSYFAARIQAADYSTTFSAGADPMTIAKRVMDDAMAASSVAGGITVVLNPSGGSGQTVQASYPGTQLSTIQQIVDNLAAMGYTLGFDYSFDVQYAPGTKTPVVTLNLWYPRKGRVASQNGIVIMHRDAIGFTYEEDSTKQFNDITETGSGNGGLQPVKITSATSGYPLLQAAVSHPDVNDLSILANQAVNDLAMSSWPVTTPTVTLPVPVPNPTTGVVPPEQLGLGQFTIGDNALYRIDPVAGGGENTCPRFPLGMNFEWRITNWTVTVPDQGVPTLLFDLSVPPVNTIPPTQPPL